MIWSHTLYDSGEKGSTFFPKLLHGADVAVDISFNKVLSMMFFLLEEFLASLPLLQSSVIFESLVGVFLFEAFAPTLE